MQDDTDSLLPQVIERREEIQRSIIEWAKFNLRKFPWRENRTPYTILVTEILLRRTTASAVFRIYENFLDDYPSIDALMSGSQEKLEAALTTIGYHKQRAKIFKDIASFIHREYKGEIPCSAKKLLATPHIGNYIAGAILSFGYGKPAAMVDSNIQRILSRVFSRYLRGYENRPPTKLIWKIAENLLPKDQHELYHFGLLDLGALVCRYDKPRCGRCPLIKLCDYPKRPEEPQFLE